MRIVLEILRREHAGAKPYVQCIPYETEDAAATVATALRQINADPGTVDADGAPVGEIRWECSCLQKKCGACAMVIGGVPRLACDARLSECGERVRIEPLRKFPVIADLIVDRSILFENLKTMQLWMQEAAAAEGCAVDTAYEASRCLQCGCCLEICPNWYAGGAFFGTAAIVPTSRLLTTLPDAVQKELRSAYRKHLYGGCGKSLACRKVCPAGIDIDGLLVNSNAIAVWRRRRK